MVEMIPQSPNNEVLITSRCYQLAYWLAGRVDNVLVVEQTTSDRAVTLFRNKAGRKVDVAKEEVKELTELLEYFPLPISQAAGYINQGHPSSTVGNTSINSNQDIVQQESC